MYAVRIPIGIALLGLLAGIGWLDVRLGNGAVFAGLVALVAMASLGEVFALAGVRDVGLRWVGILGGGALIAAQWADTSGATGSSLGGLAAVEITLGALLTLLTAGAMLLGSPPPETPRPVEHTASQLAWVAGGLCYVGVPLWYVMKLRLELPGDLGVPPADVAAAGIGLVLYVVLVAKGADMGGYLIGKSFGRTKLMPTVSPNKSWEGFAGGVAVTLLLAVVAAEPLMAPALAPPDVYWTIGLAALLAPLSLCGDLTESYLKRWADVKDSGHLLPAYGGVLDLIDSLTFCAPAGYLLLKLGLRS